MSRSHLSLVLLFAILVCMAAAAQQAVQIVTESQNQARSRSQHYEGVLEVLNSKRQTTQKRWTYDRIGSFGNSRSMLRFVAPKEVQGVAVLMINHPERAADEWIWIPAEGRDRHVAVQNRATRFFGTDFSFEDLEERDVNQFEYNLLGDDTLNGVVCWKIQSRPRQSKYSQYDSSLLWIAKSNDIVLRVDNFKKNRLIRQLLYSDVERISGIWTARQWKVTDYTAKSTTVLRFESVEYNLNLEDKDFTREALHH